jgi:energy-coupling factor transporter ATP-binding protein EcfA2
MNKTLQDLLLARLIESGASDEPWALAILAALDGPDELEAFLEETKKRELPALPQSNHSAETSEPPGVYLTSLTVEGFRGIGAPVTLKFAPGPGLTLVVGRNGSGKSSLAEGLEMLLTNNNYRWEGRPKAWQEGWRNIHQTKTVALRADLLVEGQGKRSVTRAWKSSRLDESQVVVQRDGKTIGALDEIFAKASLAAFRPFLSYNELGSLLDEGPAALYDALSSALGLEEMVAVEKILGDARKSQQKIINDAKAGAAELVQIIDNLPANQKDGRHKAASTALKWSHLDLSRLTKLVSGESKDEDPDLAVLGQLQTLEVPDADRLEKMAESLDSAERACAIFAGSSVERSLERAQLLEDALAFHDKHRDSTCPVCFSPHTLSDSWRSKADAEIEKLRTEAQSCRAADANRKERIRQAHALLNPPSPVLARASHLTLPSLALTRELWLKWSTGRELQTASALSKHLRTYANELATAVDALIAEAECELKRKFDNWKLVAATLAQWIPDGQAAQKAIPQVDQLKRAGDWWKETSVDIRNERFAPIAERAMAIWKDLRLQSSVNLEGVVLEGIGIKRKVALEVTVDGKPATALGVMSQGELHALALSLFLPRATAPESPFRFIWIDDPVQSMDPARVEGLAKTLADAARTRQVVVFTHDDRLPEAVRRLNIPATVYAVTRRASSSVEVRPTRDPVSSHLDDARALARTKELPTDVRARVVPGFCRAAIEAACMDVVRRRRLGRGELHEPVEDLLLANSKLYPLMSLALFDSSERTADVLARLKRAGNSHVEAFQACKVGAHGSFDGDANDLIADSESLTRFVLKECQ